MFIGAQSLTSKNRLDANAEQILIEQCRKQNMEAFGQIVDAYQNRVFGFVKRMVGSAEEAEDVAQEVFIRAYQSVHRFDGRCSLRTWLFRIAHNLCIDVSRKKGRQISESPLTDSDNVDMIEAEDLRWNPEHLAMNDELRAVVERGISSMSDKLRTVLLLHDQEELPYEELAQMLELPVGTVKSRLFLARQHLMKTLQEYMGETA